MDVFDIDICKKNEMESVIYNTLSRQFRVTSPSESLGMISGKIDFERFRTILQDTLQNNPQTVTILPTTNCNARCWYCYEQGILRHDMAQETAEKSISFLVNKFTKPELTLNWFGGEPLLNFNIIQYITIKLNEKGYKLSSCVTTNGSLLNERMVVFFKENYEKISMCITIDDIGEAYADVKNYVDIPRERAFINVINNIKLLVEHKVSVLIRINYEDIEIAKNVHQWLDSFFKDTDRRLFHVYYAPIWNKRKEQSFDDAKCYLHQISDGMNINVLANPYMDNIVLNSIANEKRLGHCTCMNKNKVVINADGKLYRCHSLVCDEQYACGSVDTGIDTSTQGYTLFEEKIEEKCGGCALLPICSTQCRLRSILYGKETICENTKKIVPEIAKMKLKKRMNTHNRVY